MGDTLKQGSMSSQEEEVAPYDDANKDASVSRSKTFKAEADEPPPSKTYRELALENGMKYTVTDVPPLGTSLLLGLQHYLTMLGATVLIPLLVCPAMGANGSETAEVISSIFFVSGINTVSLLCCGRLRDDCTCSLLSCRAHLSDIYVICTTRIIHISCFKQALVTGTLSYPHCLFLNDSDLLTLHSPFCLGSSSDFQSSKAARFRSCRQPSKSLPTRNCKPLKTPRSVSTRPFGPSRGPSFSAVVSSS